MATFHDGGHKITAYYKNRSKDFTVQDLYLKGRVIPDSATGQGSQFLSASKTTNQTIAAGDALDDVDTWDTESGTSDFTGAFDVATGIFTVPAGMGGLYYVSGTLLWAADADAADANTRRRLAVVSTSKTFTDSTDSGAASVVVSNHWSGIMVLAAGDTVKLQASLVSVTPNAVDIDAAEFQILRIVV